MSEANVSFPERQGLLHLLWGMFARPRSALKYLNEHGGRTWWLPALLTVLLMVLSTVVAAPITTRQARDFLPMMPAEQKAQMESLIASPLWPVATIVFPAVSGAVGQVVAWLAWAGALYLGGLVMGGRSTFSQMFRTVVWTWLPYALRGLIQTIYILVTGELITPGLSGLVTGNRSISEMATAPSSVGQLLLIGFLSRIDLYLVWNLVLLVIGVTVATHLPRRKAVLVILVVWLLLAAVSLLPTLVGGFFTQQMS